MEQDFTLKQLVKQIKNGDLLRYSILEIDLLKSLTIAIDRINKGEFEFNLRSQHGYTIANDLINILLIRKLNDNIEKLYKDKQNNRNLIIQQIISLLEENTPMWILKTDISSFYESINRNKLMRKLSNDQMLSNTSIQLLSTFFDDPLLSGTTGLPRGINISATLSELYMRKFDTWVARQTGIYYYARYVDDILMFCYSKKTVHKLKNTIDSKLNEGLTLHKGKTKIFDGNTIKELKPLEYLGYKFTTSILKKRKKTVNIAIAENKIRKIKTRITYSFLDYSNTNDFPLLKKRIEFLTGNHVVRKSRDGSKLKSGIFFNYPQVNITSIFDELNSFYRKILYSKNNSFGKRISKYLDVAKRNTLSKYSFKHGFKQKVIYNFSETELKNIQKCWQ